MSEKPIIIVGSPHDARSVGDGASNGGVKSQNLWVNLLRAHGYEAYFVTYDGSQVQWLVNHAPVVSIETVKQWKAEGKPLKGMTTWLWSNAFFEVFNQYYLYDEELAFTSDYTAQRGLLEQHLAQNRIIKLGTHSRTQVGWYMAAYDLAPSFIPEWSDPDVFHPDAAKQIDYRIGYFDEGAHTHDVINEVLAACNDHHITDESFLQISGNEAEVRDKLQTCDIVLGMNTGKWRFGEGCPRGQQEAMHCGAVLVSFNVWGNYEYLLDDFTGYMVPCGRADVMADRVVELLTDRQRLNQMRFHSIDLAMKGWTPERRWRAVADFLDLEECS